MAKRNPISSLIVSFYLSKFDDLAYQELGFGNKRATHQQIGKILGVNPNSIKNMRDEFDPIHDNERVGWYQRPLPPSRAKVVELFQDMLEIELRDFVLGVLHDTVFENSNDYLDIVKSINKKDKEGSKKSMFILRGPTGRKAEEFFIENQNNASVPLNGELKDKREYGCGYDFEINYEEIISYVEVKGLAGDSGGIVFTSKEWDVAQKKGDDYYLAVVRNVLSIPYLQIIKNPSAKLKPKKSVYQTAQISWNVSENDLTIYN